MVYWFKHQRYGDTIDKWRWVWMGVETNTPSWRVQISSNIWMDSPEMGWSNSVFFLNFYGWILEPPMAVLSHESWLGFGTPNHQNMSEPIHHSDAHIWLVYFFQQKQQPNLFSPLKTKLITYPVACFNVLHSSIPTLLEDELGVSQPSQCLSARGQSQSYLPDFFRMRILFMFRIVCNIYTENITPGVFWAGLNQQRSYCHQQALSKTLRMMDLEPLVMRSRDRSELKA